jgi:hypothetical protein
MNIWLIAVIWSAFSFFLHITIHEAAHAIAALLAKGKVVSFFPFPSSKLGYYTWGHVELLLPAGSKNYKYILAAPLLADSLWILGSIPFLIWGGMIMKVIALIEITYSLIDIGTWFMGWIKNNPTSDGGRVRNILFKREK